MGLFRRRNEAKAQEPSTTKKSRKLWGSKSASRTEPNTPATTGSSSAGKASKTHAVVHVERAPTSDLPRSVQPPRRDLGSELCNRFIHSELDDKEFLPANEIKRLITKDEIRSSLPPGTPAALIDFVLREAGKLFLTLVIGNETNSNELSEIMKICRTYRMTDDYLPIGKLACIGGNASCDPPHHGALRVFHHHLWSSQRRYYRFRHDQELFHAPILNQDRFIYELKDQCVLPIIRKGRRGNEGHFSTVYEVWIHPSHHHHHTSGTPQASKELHVALKKLKHITNEPGYNVEDAFYHEANALQKISDLHHKNLIRPIAAIKRGSDFFIMFEWANGGNLRALWDSQKQEPDTLSPDRVMNMLEELKGLAGALATLHNQNNNTKTGKIVQRAPKLTDPESLSPRKLPRVQVQQLPASDSESPPQTPDQRLPKVRFYEASDDGSHISEGGDRSYASEDSGSDGGGDEHWRHGDLKPENILLFRDPLSQASSWLGTLKIADLGLAKQHKFATTRRNDQTNMKYTTSHYEAPEANRIMASSHLPRSRRFDIWSMGCVILEFVIVMLYGKKGLDAFYKETKYLDETTETLYFTVDTGRRAARVSHVATHWIEHILKDPECSRPRSAMADVVRLVRDRLVVVNLPSHGMTEADILACRADSAELKLKLEKIWQRARDDEQSRGNYLCSRINRKGIPIPASTGGRRPRPPPTTTSQLLGHDLQHNKQRSLTHAPLDTTWDFIADNDFANMLLELLKIQGFALVPPRSAREHLCSECQRIDIMDTHLWMFKSDTHKGWVDCRLHQLFYEVAGMRTDYLNNSPIEVTRSGSHFFLKDDHSPILSICRTSVNDLLEESNPHINFQIGFPELMPTDSNFYFRLLSQWIADCDKNHQHTCHRRDVPSISTRTLPTRLLDVGDDNDEQLMVYLRVSDHLATQSAQSGNIRYVALSHPWGDARLHDHFCTTAENFDDRLTKGMAVKDMPKTFQDAVKVARALGVRYIWIDSLCIKQGVKGDFHSEAKFMETVFSSAYFVIAASQATGTSDGFLQRRSQPRRFVRLDQEFPGGETVYICEAIDNFQSDVIDGHLNKRGWVLQERALARRTIYFTAKQAYFECGAGVRSETFTKMINNQAAFLGDPNFPNLALKSTKGARIRFYEYLYKTYSRLEFTKPYDRPIAIAGIEQRLVAAFNTHGGYGIFDGDFFGRSLLWKRDSDQGMKKIDFKAGGQTLQAPSANNSGSYTVPTWSWMGYEGAITYVEIPFGEAEWNYKGERGVRSPWSPTTTTTATTTTMTASCSSFGSYSTSASWHTGTSGGNVCLRAWASPFSVSFAALKDKICFDAGIDAVIGSDVDWERIKCVIVGRRKMKTKDFIVKQQQKNAVAALLSETEHYVLVVIAAGSPKDGASDRYERVGVAVVPGGWISREQEAVRIF